jgi:hypothetical protein
MVEVQPDNVFESFAPADSVAVCGWVEDRGENLYYLWITSDFTVRLELTADQILHQIPGSKRPDGSSIVWIRRDARIARSQILLAGELRCDAPGEENLRVPKY